MVRKERVLRGTREEEAKRSAAAANKDRREASSEDKALICLRPITSRLEERKKTLHGSSVLYYTALILHCTANLPYTARLIS